MTKKTKTNQELTAAQKAKKAKDAELQKLFKAMMSEPAPEPATPAVDFKAKADAAKKLGNKAFLSKDYETAVKHFTSAISWSADKAYFSNRSAAYVCLKQYEKAIADAERCIKLDPKWVKGHSRLGSALYHNGDGAEAVAAYARGMALDPTNKALLKGLTLAQAHADANPTKKKKVTSEGDKEEYVNETGGAAVGIDLGTTNSCVAVYRNGQIEIIPDGEGKRTQPSVVGFKAGGERLIGHAAVTEAASNVDNTVYETKRLIGRAFSDGIVQSDVDRLPFTVIGSEDDKPLISIEIDGNTETFAPEQISAMVLTKMKQIAEAYLDQTVDKAVITVPAYFNDAQRNATTNAGQIAGLEVLRIINEPTAAALAYGLDKGSKEASTVLVFDLGGGTFDVSLLSIEGGIFEVLATGGDTHLGGEDFDDLLTEFLKEHVRRQHRNEAEDILGSKRAMRRLRRAAERAKRTLSAALTASVEVDDIADGVDFTCTVTRAKFEKLCQEPFQRCLDKVKSVMKDGKMSVESVTDVVLVGGSTRIPKVQSMLQEYFKGRELCKAVNPDEAVAHGAAVQAAILTGQQDSTTAGLLLVDVTPLSLGIETTGRVMSTLIKRNTAIPCRVTKVYTTEADYQDSVDICVYEGERTCTDGNNMLGEFTITGIQRAKRGEPKVAVTFDLDANGMLKVTALDETTGAENSVTIKNKGRLTSAEVDAMVADAEKFKAADNERMRKIEARNELETLIYQGNDAAEYQITDSQRRDAVRRAVATAQGWLDQVNEASPPSVAQFDQQRRQLEKVMYGR